GQLDLDALDIGDPDAALAQQEAAQDRRGADIIGRLVEDFAAREQQPRALRLPGLAVGRGVAEQRQLAETRERRERAFDMLAPAREEDLVFLAEMDQLAARQRDRGVERLPADIVGQDDRASLA